MQRDMFMLHLFIIILTCKYLVILWNTKIKQDSETSLMQKMLKATLSKLGFQSKRNTQYIFLLILGNDYVIVSPERFSRIKAFRYLLSRHIDGLEKGELKRNYISQLCKDWKWTRPTVVSFLKSLQQMNVIDIKQILSAKMVSVNPTIIVTSLSKEELDKVAQRKLLQLPSPLPHSSSGETK